MSDRVEYLYHATSRELFIYEMGLFENPLTETPLATLDDAGNLIPTEGLRIDEVGEVIKTPAVLHPDTGDIITPAVIVPGHHVNLWVYDDLAYALTAGMPTEGNVFERTRILDMLPTEMTWAPISEIGIPEGYEGSSGSRIFDPEVVSSRVRVWA